jgi:hypothetical protein
MTGETCMIVFGLCLISFGLGGAAVRYVAGHQMRAYQALIRSLENECYRVQRSKAVIR